MTEETKKSPPTNGAIDRRTMMGRGAAAAGVLAASPFLPGGQARAQGTASNPFTVVGAGEVMVTRNIARQSEPAFRALVDRMQKADLTYAHLEMLFGTPDELKWTPRGQAGVASYMNADPSIAKDLADMGIDALSLAHNHSFDWGTEGLFATQRHVAAAGIAHSGTGKNLMAARAPVFFDVDDARVAMVSIGSGNNNYEWAGLPIGDVDGRPGMNPLRVTTRYEVDQTAAQQLKAIGQQLGVLNDAAAARPEFNITPGTGVSGTGTASFSFVEGDKFDITSAANPEDAEANLRSVRWGAEMADFVMVSHHNSTSEGARGIDPSGFVIDFARQTIDAGADVYWGHGWHTYLGVEIYNGKPIVYGMGNFVYQTAHLVRIPADSFASYGRDLNNLGGLHPTADMHPGGGEDWYWSALFELDYVGGELRQIRLHPVEMGADFSTGKLVKTRTVGGDQLVDGTPHLATGANAQAILRKIQERNSRRGTQTEIRGNVAIINV